MQKSLNHFNILVSMKQTIAVICLFGFSFFCQGQEDAWVYFTDKPMAQSFLDNPTSMLSTRSLNRRNQHQITLDIHDVPVDSNYKSAIANSPGIIVKAQSKWLNALHIRGAISNIQALTQLPCVSKVRFANHSLNPTNKTGNVISHSKAAKPTAVAKTSLTNFSSLPYGNAAAQIQLEQGQALHEVGYTGQNTWIAVLDNGFTGVDTHPAFQRFLNQNQWLGGYDFVNRTSQVFHEGGHGTMVLSSMVGYVENQLIGTAPDASYFLCVTEDISTENPLEESLWVEAAEKADSLGVDIINTSLGYFTYINDSYSYTYANMDGQTSFIARGLEVAFSRGILCVTAGGNSAQTSNPYISTPADAPHSLTIGAVDAAGNYASFSSIGPTADGRIKPDAAAFGFQAYVANAAGSYSYVNGTSLAAPIVTGLAACLWQANPALTHEQMRQTIIESSHLFQNPTMLLGHGIPNFSQALTQLTSVKSNVANDLLVYPNPVLNDTWIRMDSPEAAQAFLYTIDGRLLWSENRTTWEHPINMSFLATGSYLLVIQAAQKKWQQLIIKK
ncbi:MAG: peptidase S8 [Flavobacterium sp. BFFFF2]|nr:MAG: peptidase S8 [Flavobacterium sp. BFFFF2]